MNNDEQFQPIAAVVETPFLSDTTVQVESVSLSDTGLSISVTSKHWNAECSLSNGWLFEVKTGGWKALEQTRPRFSSGRHEWVKNSLLVGRNECVSVLTKEPPSLT